MSTTSEIIYWVMGGWGFFSAYSIFNLWRQKNTDKYNPYLYNSIPSVFTTLGVLGTFLGIFAGLQGFDVANIDKSIPILLEGMKTAFLTSIVGIVASIVFRPIGQYVLRNVELKEPIKQTSELSALSQIVAILKETNTEAKNNSSQLTNLINQSSNNHSEVATILKETNTEAKNNSNQLAKLINISSENHSEVATILEEANIEAKNNSSQITKLINISSENHTSLENKFDGFAEILKKNNTEALVEVMQNATEAFNAQMNELIQRLVKENFQELNNSVQSLNTWQHENKEMIKSLTNQFEGVSENLTISSTSIKEIAQNTNKLTNDNSHLSKIIQELQKVMVDDNTFTKINKKLEATVNDLFDTGNKLNQTLSSQNKFQDAVFELITQLEQFKDFNSSVWDSYRGEMLKAVGIIKESSKQLTTDIDARDKQFYERLSTTFMNLDEIMRELVN